MRGTKVLADRRADFIPHGRTAKLRKLTGEYQIDHERHIHQLLAGVDVSPVGSCIAGLFSKSLGNHEQRFRPRRIVHVVGSETVYRVAIIVAQVEKPRADVERCAILLKLLMLELKHRFWILNALKNVVRRERRDDRRALPPARSAHCPQVLLRRW